MQALVNAVNQSTLTRLLANIFLFLLVCCALAIATFEILNGIPINSFILSLLSIGAGYALTVLGINHGSTLTPSVLESSTTAATPSAVSTTVQTPTVTVTAAPVAPASHA